MSGVEEVLASSALLDLAAEALDDAHWCESNYTKGCNCREWRERQAGYILAVVAEQLQPLIWQARAEAWDAGYRSGFSNAMRRMSDEPNAPTTPNPHLGGCRSRPCADQIEEQIHG